MVHRKCLLYFCTGPSGKKTDVMVDNGGKATTDEQDTTGAVSTGETTPNMEEAPANMGQVPLNVGEALLGADIFKEDIFKEELKGETDGKPLDVKLEPKGDSEMEALDIKLGPQGELLLPFNLSVQYVKQEEVKQENIERKDVIQEEGEHAVVKEEDVAQETLESSEMAESEMTPPETSKKLHPKTARKLKRQAMGKRLNAARQAKGKDISDKPTTESMD